MCAFCRFTSAANCVKFASVGSGSCGKYPSGLLFKWITWHPSFDSSVALVTHPAPLTESTTTLNRLHEIPFTST